MYGDKGGARWRYGRMKEEERGSNCQNCGQCEELCPQKIKIRDDLAAASAELEALLK
jgi:predicted aldo/keto reductase-like oxidoreductase